MHYPQLPLRAPLTYGFAILVTFDGLRQLGGDEGEQGWRRRGALLSNKSFSRAVGSTQDIDPN